MLPRIKILASEDKPSLLPRIKILAAEYKTTLNAVILYNTEPQEEMPKIYSVKEPLPIERVTIAKPVNKNGSHFIKTLDVDDPIYFLAPKSFSKQGFVNHGKKIFCDLVFSNENSDFFSWLENLEEKVKAGIYENRDKWFETPLDEHDIESSMTPPYKPYKSGKFFIIRANVPTALGKINIKVYDENENETENEAIKENTNVLAVLEFQGVRCGVRSFQFEIELKQILIVEPEKIFEKCVIANVKKDPVFSEPSVSDSHSDPPENTHQSAKFVEDVELVTDAIQSTELIKEDEDEDEDEDKEESGVQVDAIVVEESENPFESSTNALDLGPIEITDDAFPLDNFVDSASDEPPIRLKSRNDVYYKLYKETRQRAREAKREPLANYLEAKRIKTTYLLEDVSDSDSDDDLEESVA